ncbi:hypothetical protein C3L33_23426, partial [Rhododendron williamsianum]
MGGITNHAIVLAGRAQVAIASFFTLPNLLELGHLRFVNVDGHDADDPKQSTADMTVFVQNLLQQMMGGRIDELEQSINDLRAEMGQEGSPSPSSALKLKDEPKSADDSA